MKVRKHDMFGDLSDSMRTVKEIEPTRAALIEWIRNEFGTIPDHEVVNLEVNKYGPGIDERIGWDTYIVHLPGHRVFGYTDGPLES